jgi:hypothetical protein
MGLAGIGALLKWTNSFNPQGHTGTCELVDWVESEFEVQGKLDLASPESFNWSLEPRYRRYV